MLITCFNYLKPVAFQSHGVINRIHTLHHPTTLASRRMSESVASSTTSVRSVRVHCLNFAGHVVEVQVEMSKAHYLENQF